MKKILVILLLAFAVNAYSSTKEALAPIYFHNLNYDGSNGWWPLCSYTVDGYMSFYKNGNWVITDHQTITIGLNETGSIIFQTPNPKAYDSFSSYFTLSTVNHNYQFNVANGWSAYYQYNCRGQYNDFTYCHKTDATHWEVASTFITGGDGAKDMNDK